MSSVTVTAPSRLHFGLFAVPGNNAMADSAPSGLEQRCFGGVGMMIDRPGVRLHVEPAPAWSARSPSAQRALEFARRFTATLPEAGRRQFAIDVEHCAPEHAGLGTGTQLGLAVARALALLSGLEHEDAVALARRVGRGLRSSLGIHGFQHGGFLVEAGKTARETVAPLVVRHAFPEEWRVLVVIPRGLYGEHGSREVEAFAKITATDGDVARTDALCRLTLLGMLPALVERDLAAFGEAVHEFNRKAGEWFAAWQGGVYSHPRVAELIALLRREGIRGVGQSSWGPAVFAIAEKDRLDAVRPKLPTDAEAELCAAENRELEKRCQKTVGVTD
jgi:beta-ribofuranosylaminobenzene 5'-phosphate synthase